MPLRGEPKVYIKTADSGTKRAHASCPDRGTPICAAAISDPPTYPLRVGAIKQRVEPLPEATDLVQLSTPLVDGPQWGRKAGPTMRSALSSGPLVTKFAPQKLHTDAI